MEYRSVGHRCAVDLDALRLPIPPTEAMAILATLGARMIAVDIVALAKGCIGSTAYRRGAHPREAPGVADCSSLVQWLYGQRGVWLPRRAIQQRAYGEPVPRNSIRACDLVFTSGRIDRYDHDPADGVGHVGIAIDAGTVVHAANARAGVIASPLDRFAPPDIFRGARRYLPLDRTIHTIEIPDARCVETTDDVRWIILGHLPHAPR